MNIRSYLWTFPFIFFCSGYFIAHLYLHAPSITTPTLLGKQLHEASALASDQTLSIRLLDTKENDTVPSGTVLYQTPQPGHLIKPRQTIYLTLSKLPAVTSAPLCIGKTKKEIEKMCSKLKVKPKLFPMPSTHPQGTCITQYPLAERPLPNKQIVCYYSDSNTQAVIVPNLIDMPLSEVRDFLELNSIELHISNPNNYKETHAIIADQRPLAGSILPFNEMPYIQAVIAKG